MYPNVEVKILPADYSLALEPTYISELCEQVHHPLSLDLRLGHFNGDK